MSKINWTYKKLNELGFVGRGKSKHRPRNDVLLYGGSYPFIQTGDIKAAELYISNYTQTYNDKGLSQSKLWEPGTLCITIAANIGETAILKIKACFPDSIVGFIADPNISDVRFVKYSLDTKKQQMQSISKGATQDNLPLEKLLSLKFLVPPVFTQQKIASILSAYDDLIENNTRRIQILEEMAQRIYREWFVNFRFPGYEKVKFVDSEMGKIPEGWEISNLEHIAELVKDKFHESQHYNLPLLDLSRIPRKSLVLSDFGKCDEIKTSRIIFKEGNILFGAIRPYFHKVVMAPCDGVTNISVFVLKSTNIVGNCFLFNLLFSDEVVA